MKKKVIQLYSVEKGEIKIPKQDVEKFETVADYLIYIKTPNAEIVDFFEDFEPALDFFNKCEPFVEITNDCEIHTYYIIGKLWYNIKKEMVNKYSFIDIRHATLGKVG